MPLKECKRGGHAKCLYNLPFFGINTKYMQCLEFSTKTKVFQKIKISRLYNTRLINRRLTRVNDLSPLTSSSYQLHNNEHVNTNLMEKMWLTLAGSYIKERVKRFGYSNEMNNHRV